MKLEPSAQQLLSLFQQNERRIDAKLESTINAQTERVGKPMSKADLEALLVAALPEKASAIQTLSARCMSHQVDGTNPSFLTQMIGIHRIEKDRAGAVYTPVTVPARDPLYADFVLAPDAGALLLFNASKFDERGRPLLMKVIARESMKDAMPDLSIYHALERPPELELVADDAALVKVKDEDEREFAFGDAVAHVSLDRAGREISRGGAVGPTNQQVTRYFDEMLRDGRRVPNLAAPRNDIHPLIEEGQQLDRSAVLRFSDRVHVEVRAKEGYDRRAWLDAPLAQFETKLEVEPGYVLEPGTKASVSLAGVTVWTGVDAGDFSFNGSPSASALVTGNDSIRAMLGGNLTEASGRPGASDHQQTARAVANFVHPPSERVEVAGSSLSPFSDRVVMTEQLSAARISAHLEPLVGDRERDGQRVRVKLREGFLKGANVEGWTIDVGAVVGPIGAKAWTSAPTARVERAAASQEIELSVDLPKVNDVYRSDTMLELRVFDARGVPAQRIMVPLSALGWGVA